MSLYDKLIEHLRSTSKEENYDLTAKKVSNRAFNFKEENGCIYFEMKRHEAALRCMYTPGLGMAAYKTRTEEYKYCPDSNNLTQTMVSEPKLDIDSIDTTALAEEAFSDFFSKLKKLMKNYIC